MDNKDNQAWETPKLQEWKKFWESEMGEEALKKMRAIKEQCFNDSMGQADPNMIAAYIGRAAGIELILQDIQAGIAAAELREEETPHKD